MTDPPPPHAQTPSLPSTPPPPAGAAPPPRYDYPPSQASSGQQVNLELRQIDSRLDVLYRERAKYSLGGPITMMAVGFGCGALCGIYGLMFLALGGVDEDSEAASKAGGVLLGAAGVGIVMGIVGSVRLRDNIHARRQDAPEIKRLRRRRKYLLQRLRFGVQYSRNGAQLNLSTHF